MLLVKLRNIFIALFLMLLVFGMCRGLFFLFNYSAFQDISFLPVLKLFYHGIWFDYSVLVYLNVLFVLYYLLPFSFVTRERNLAILGWAVFILNTFLVLVNLIDLEYYKFTGKRTTSEIITYLGLSNDILYLFPRFIIDFWYIPLFWIIFSTGSLWLFRKLYATREITARKGVLSLLFSLFMGVLISACMGALARGTELKPIQVITAAKYASSKNIPLVLNTPFTILHTMGMKDIKRLNYFDDDQLDAVYSPVSNFAGKAEPRFDNVIVIILESFSKQYCGAFSGNQTITPFFDSLAMQGARYVNALANGKRSIDALPAILAGIPCLMDKAYVSSPYSFNHIEPLPYLLARQGYHTSFFHGARNGSMSFDLFASMAGIKNYYGMNEYEGPPAYDGHWGIRDQEFLQYSASCLSQFPEPFFSTIFTLSSHHPYSLPEAYRDSFPSLNSPLERSIRYADQALSKFFETISMQPWFNRTLFVFVADHTAQEQTGAGAQSLGMFQVPLLFYHPSDSSLTGEHYKISQQSDIMPSILDYLNYSAPFVAFGKSVFSNEPSFSITYLGGIYQYVSDKELVKFDGERVIGYHEIETNSEVKVSEREMNGVPVELNRLKAILQQFNNRLLENNLRAN